MKNYLSLIIPLVIVLLLFGCQESPPLSVEEKNNSTAKFQSNQNRLYKTSNTFSTSIQSTKSEEPLNLSSLPQSKFPSSVLSGTMQISDEGYGSINFSQEISEKEKPYLLPNKLELTTEGLQYYNSEGKLQTVPFDEHNRKALEIMSQARKKIALEKQKVSSLPKVNFSAMKSSEVENHFKEKGYEVKNLGNNRYELSRSLRPNGNTEGIIIKSIFNASTSMPEKAEIYRNGIKISEHLMEAKTPEELWTHSKLYNNNSSREEKNGYIVNKYSLTPQR